MGALITCNQVSETMYTILKLGIYNAAIIHVVFNYNGVKILLDNSS